MKLTQVSVLLAGLFSSAVWAQVDQVIQTGYLLDVRTGNYQKTKLFWLKQDVSALLLMQTRRQKMHS